MANFFAPGVRHGQRDLVHKVQQTRQMGAGYRAYLGCLCNSAQPANPLRYEAAIRRQRLALAQQRKGDCRQYKLQYIFLAPVVPRVRQVIAQSTQESGL